MIETNEEVCKLCLDKVRCEVRSKMWEKKEGIVRGGIVPEQYLCYLKYSLADKYVEAADESCPYYLEHVLSNQSGQKGRLE